jgi:hypothetical protein
VSITELNVARRRSAVPGGAWLPFRTKYAAYFLVPNVAILGLNPATPSRKLLSTVFRYDQLVPWSVW